jgi:malate dehydrogenase (oxaloacetate-decarboxylating)(NADP+)
VARARSTDFDAYREKLQSFVYASGTHDEADLHDGQARQEQARGLRRGRGPSACCAPPRWSSTRSLARPTLMGRPAVIAQRIEQFGLRLKAGRDYDVVNVENDPRYRDFWQTYHR